MSGYGVRALPTLPPSAPPFPQDRRCPYQPPADYVPLAEDGPLAQVTLYDGRRIWLVTGHAEARALLADTRLSADRRNPAFPVITPRHEGQGTTALPILGADDPEHARQRRMLLPPFALKRVNAMRPRIQRIVDELLDAMLAAGPGADLVPDFALPVPSKVICHLLGIPCADHGFFEASSLAVLTAKTSAEATVAFGTFSDYLKDLVERKRTDPGEGIIGELAAGRIDTGELSRDQVAMTALLLLVAGHETTSNMISLGVYTLFAHPGQLAALHADATLTPGAVEELLRYLSVVDGLIRVATEDIEVGGVTVRAGDGVTIGTSMANRDAAVYGEPHTLDVHRSARHHLAFGYGAHQCLGQNLARVELEIALNTLVRRVPTLRLAVAPDEVTVKPGHSVQGLFSLPVTW
jgi:pentalenic acid synthase